MPAQTWRIGPIVLSGLAALAAIISPAARTAETKQVLIAAETSVFKDAVVAQVTETLARDGYAVRVTTLDQAEHEAPDSYRAILLIGSCRAWRPNQNVLNLLGRAGADNTGKFVVVTTAGSGKCDFSSPGVDFVSTASKRMRIEDVSQTILDKLRARLVSP